MRIGIGLVILADLIIRATALNAHYTSDGILPVSLFLEYDFKPLRWSFHFLNDSFAFESFLFIVHAFLTILLISGYKTRIITVLSWLFLASLQNRNPFIQQSGDDLLRLVLFWAIFLPWGNFYSIDSLKKKNTSKYYFSVSTFAYMLLIVSVYVFSAIYKASPEWRTEGTAIYYALSLDQIRVGLGDWLYQYPLLMKFLTLVVFYYFEIIAPLFILVPYKNPYFRCVGAFSIMALHLGIGSTLYVGLFFTIGITSTIGLLPPSLMDKIDTQFAKSKFALTNSNFKYYSRPVLKLIVGSFLFCSMLYCLMMNLSNISSFKYVLDERTMAFNNLFKLEQYWGMFSPHIYKNDGWYIYRGIKANDSIWDIYNNKAGLDRSKPKNIDKMYPTDRWRKLAENYQKNDFNFMRPYYCRYLIRAWNKKHPENKISGLNIIFLMEESLPDYKTKPIKEQNTCLCYENEPVK